MGIFDSKATKRGRKQGELQRIMCTTSGLRFLSGEKLITKARSFAEFSWYHDGGHFALTHGWEAYADDYVKSFLLAYTKSAPASEPKDAPEMDVRYEEEQG